MDPQAFVATCRRLRASLDALEKQARLAQQGSASASSEAPDGDVGSEVLDLAPPVGLKLVPS